MQGFMILAMIGTEKLIIVDRPHNIFKFFSQYFLDQMSLLFNIGSKCEQKR